MANGDDKKPFDPDAYLKKFDPDKYLAGKSRAAQPDPQSVSEALTTAAQAGAFGAPSMVPATAAAASGLLGVPQSIVQGITGRDIPGMPALRRKAGEIQEPGRTMLEAEGAAMAPWNWPYEAALGLGTAANIGIQGLRGGFNALFSPQDDPTKFWQGARPRTEWGAAIGTGLGALPYLPRWAGAAVRRAAGPLIQNIRERAAAEAHNLGLDRLFQQATRSREDAIAAEKVAVQQHKELVEQQREAHAQGKQETVEAIRQRKADVATEAREHAAATQYQQSLVNAAAEAAKQAQKTAEVGHQAEVGVARSLHEAAQTSAELTQKDIPRQTTLGWWKEGWDALGQGNRAPKDIDPGNSAELRNAIGTELNDVRNQLTYDTRPHYSTQYPATVSDNPAMTGLRNVQSGAAGEVSSLGPQAVAGFNAEFEATVLNPLRQGNELGRKLTGSEFTDYVSKINTRAHELRIQAGTDPTANKAYLYRTANGLQAAADRIEEDAIGVNPALTQQLKDRLTRGKRAYNVWSIGDQGTSMASRDPNVSPPAALLQAWQSRYSGSPARFYEQSRAAHPDNARIQDWLISQQRAMNAPVGPGTFIPPRSPLASAQTPMDIPALSRRELPSAAPTEEEKTKLGRFAAPKREPGEIPPKPERGTPVDIPPQHPLRRVIRGAVHGGEMPLALLGLHHPLVSIARRAGGRSLLDPDLERAIGAWLLRQPRTTPLPIPGITGPLTPERRQADGNR